MSIITSAAIAGGAGIAGSLIVSHAAGKAASQQVNAQQQALDFQKQQWQTQQDNMAPWLSAGKTSLGTLMTDMGNGTFGPGSVGPAPQYTGGPFTAPTAADAAATPGYQFTKQQADAGIAQRAAAMGGLNSGGTAQALASYDTGLANSTYNDVFNRSLATYNTGLQDYQAQLQGYGAKLAGQGQAYNQLAGLAGVGQTAAQSLNNTGSQVATNVGTLMGNIGNSQAAGTVGSANALSGGLAGIGNSANNALQNLMFSRIFAPGGATDSLNSGLQNQLLQSGYYAPHPNDLGAAGLG